MKRIAGLCSQPCSLRCDSPVTRSMLISCFRQAPKSKVVNRAIITQAQAAAPEGKLQQLYQQAQAAFGNGKHPSCPADWQAVSQALQEVPLQELGLQAPSEGPQNQTHGLFGAFRNKQRSPPITYIHIYEDQTMSIGMFCLPRNASIPLHNHPGMVVLSRVLFGSLHVLSYDWAEAQHSVQAASASKSLAAKLVLDEVVEPTSQPAVIFPAAGGNIHQFTAVTDCAVLDILAPPYSPKGGRDCTYYKAIKGDLQGFVHLMESKPSPPINMQNKSYTGVKIKAARV